jgi:hypothetical protein
VIADNDFADFSLAVDQQADLPVDFPGKKRYLSDEIIGDDAFRGNAFIPKALQLFDVRRF